MVGDPSWQSGGSIVLTFRDDKQNPSTGVRCAQSYDGYAGRAPLLHIERDSRIAHWLCDEGTGLIAHDSVGKADGVLVGATWSKGKSLGGLSFDGASYADLGTDPNLMPPEVTLSAWIAPAAKLADMAVVHKGGAFIEADLLLSQGPLVFQFGDPNSTTFFRLTSKAVLPLKDWTHVAVTRDSTTVTLYVNGVGDNWATYASAVQPPAGAGPSLLRIGAPPYVGGIDDVRIYGVALSPNDVQSIYNQMGKQP